MARLTAYSGTNVLPVANNSAKRTGLTLIQFGRRTHKASRPICSLPQNITVPQKRFSEK